MCLHRIRKIIPGDWIDEFLKAYETQTVKIKKKLKKRLNKQIVKQFIEKFFN